MRANLVTVTLALLPVLLPARAETQGQPVALREVPARLALTFGDGERDGDAYVMSSIRVVRQSPAGDIYVLDAKEADVKQFTSTGKYLRTFGRRGSGPGELTGPSFRMEVTDREVVVTDNMLRRNAIFTLDGKHLRTVNHASRSERTAPVESHAMRFGFSVDISPPQITANVSDLNWRVVMQGAGRRDTLAVIRAGLISVNVDGSKRHITTSFEETGLGHGGAYAFLRDSVVALVDGYRGVARWVAFTPKGPAVRRTATLPTIKGAPRAADFDSLKHMLEQRWKRSDPNPRVALSNAPPGYSVAEQALFGADGALWIGAPRANNRIEWTVFPTTGEGFRVELPAAFTLTSANGTRLYGHGKGRDDIPLVMVYQLGAR